MAAKTAYAVAWIIPLAALMPCRADAQSTISGLVTDPSGGPIANANVEASSPSLIERSRRTTTSSDGRYAIVDVRPGIYTVAFAADRFVSVERSVDVRANVTVAVDAQLAIGAVTETVSVTPANALVDVQNPTHPLTWTRGDLDAVPTARNVQSVASYAPGVHLNIPDVGGSQQIQQTYMAAHGSPHHHEVVLLDGLLINTTQSDGQVQTYPDNEMIQEATYSTIANPINAPSGGVFVNIVPKDGGNTVRGEFFGAYTPSRFVGNNLDPALLERGLTAQAKVTQIQDFDGSLGGPMRTDRLWFLLSGRRQRTFVQSPLCKNDDGTPCVERDHINTGHLRLTWRPNANNKFSAMLIRNFKKNEDEVVSNLTNGTPATVSASSQRIPYVYYVSQERWTLTATPRLRFESGFSVTKLDYKVIYQNGHTEPPFSPGWYSNVLL